MKGKQAILRYLETHRTFTAKDVATECGMLAAAPQQEAE